MSEQPQPPEAFATAEQLEAAWRPLTDAEQTVATTLLEYTSALIRNRVRRVDEWIEEGRVDPTLVRLATILVVKRVLMNPDAARQRTRTAGPFTESITIDSAVSTGALYLADSDLAVFLPTIRGGKIGTARLLAGLG